MVPTMMDLQAWRHTELVVKGPPDLQPLAETLDLVSRLVPKAKEEGFHTLQHIFDFAGYELLERSNLCGAGLLWLTTVWLTPRGQAVELVCALDVQEFTERWKVRVVPEEHVRGLLGSHPEAYRKVFGEPQVL